ncbi:phosphoesterase RecJ domain protein [Methanocaldococcus bathoardescens]|uniref:Phosphoesterase RecJ domain protein n=1 Tax=Methanocaldococcus bathoardescens TaxID=1301915 RepID=A0A076LEQ9_9EURY|nr:DHH family phosphoesterase [Methanocaldococcus bathoardescens]AIJ04913.1 phosphoesterase RecJ domain protein [Methanocaldococcus bathoardescens]
MAFDEICDEIILDYEDAKDFAYILKLIYLNEFEKIKNLNLDKFGIIEKDDLLFYGKNYPLFKSLLFFNEIPVFREEKESILFLKSIGLSPRNTLNSLTYKEKVKLGNEFLKRCIGLVPKEYISYIPQLIFGREYYFKGVCLKEYVSALNGLYKIGKKNKVKKLIISMELPDEKDVKKYKKKLAKKIDLFKKKLNSYEINYLNLKFNNKNFKCQYIYVRQSIWNKVLGLFGEEIELKYYPTLVNVAHSHEKVDFLKSLFIFVDRGDISVYAKVPKLVYLKDGLTLNHLNLRGKYIYFGNWEKERFWKIIKKGAL